MGEGLSAPGYRLSAIQREVLLHTLVLLAALAATLAGYNSPTPLVVPPDYEPQRVFRGFHAVEYTAATNTAYRWTTGAGTICAERVGQTPHYVLRLTLLGQGALPIGIEQATLQIDGTPLAMLPLMPAPRRYALLLDERHSTAGDLCVTIVSDTAQSPGDARMVGVPMQGFELQRLSRTGLTLPDLRQLALNVLAALLGFWLLRALGLRADLALKAVALVALLVGAGVGSGLVATGMDTARNLLPVLGIAAVILAATLALRSVDYLTPARPAWLHHRLTRDLLAMLIWSGVLVGAVAIIQAVYGHSGVWPLKAGVWPGFTPLVLLPLALFAAWLAALLHLLRREQPPLLPGVALILAGAVALPVLLKVSVRGWESLFLTFAANGSDYIHDVPLIGSDPLGFLGRYVELSPTLAWHNSNHPPGSVLLLWGVEQVLGPGAVPASWVAILLSSLVVVAACWLGLRLGGRHLALLAGALVAVMPGHQVYSVTSMDGVFNSLLALAAVAFFLALEPGARPWRGLLAGVLLALGLFFTYATTQLFFFGVVVCLLALQRGQPLGHVLRQGMLAVGVLLLLYGLLAATTGFNIIEAVLQAKANNARLLSDPTETNPGLMGLPSVSHYTYYLPVNLVPFLWYLAPWGLAALTPRLAAGVQNWRQPTSWHVLALALVGLVLGMWLSGLFVREVERIWGFTYPLAAVLMAVHIWQGEAPRERLWRAGLWLTLFFAQAATMRMLLNTYW
jgi:hypothetical protein